MIKRINRTEEIRKRLEVEGKVQSCDTNEHIENMVQLNLILGNLKRDYLIKDKLSQISASQTFLNS